MALCTGKLRERQGNYNRSRHAFYSCLLQLLGNKMSQKGGSSKIHKNCWWFRHTVEVGSFPHYLQGFIHPSGGFSPDFWAISEWHETNFIRTALEFEIVSGPSCCFEINCAPWSLSPTGWQTVWKTSISEKKHIAVPMSSSNYIIKSQHVHTSISKV